MAPKTEIYPGYHAAFERLRSGAVSGTLYLSSNNAKARDLARLAREQGVRVEQVGDSELARLARGKPRGAVLIATRGSESAPATLDELLPALEGPDALVVLLDGITDPQNLGSILRSADKFEVQAVIAPTRRSAGATDAVARVSAGAVAHVPLLSVTNLVQAINQLKKHEFWVYGADMGGEAAPATNLRGRVALVLGSEGEGLGRLVRDVCDSLISVPTGGHVDSLNVAVAAALLMYEVRRQQEFPYDLER